MKFAHMADCHIGGWAEAKLKDLGIEAFGKAIDMCIKEHVGFILISGDLFNTALPQIELIREVARILNKVREHDIAVYVIPGSHDFSPSGKTMIDVLEKAGLCENVYKWKDGNLEFTVDKTNTKIVGMLGKRGGLEKNDYKELNKELLERESGFKIFMFHSALTELKPEEIWEMDSQPLSSLPKNFDYYAGGHVHELREIRYGRGIVTQPGALFPNNFREMEKYQHGGFFIVNEKLERKWVPVKLKAVESFAFKADDKTAEELQQLIVETMKKKNLRDKIVTLRVEGILAAGKPSDIKFKEIIAKFPEAYFVMKNTSKLSPKEFNEQLKIEGSSAKEIEERVINSAITEIGLPDLDKMDKEMVQKLMSSLDEEKVEEEKKADFERRLIANVTRLMQLEEVLKQ